MADERAPARTALRASLLAAFALHHRRRRRRRGAAAGAVLGAVAGAAWAIALQPQRAPQAGAPPLAFRVQEVRGSPRSGMVRAIDDDELLRRLDEMGRPAGLIRIAGRTFLTEAAARRPDGPPAL